MNDDISLDQDGINNIKLGRPRNILWEGKRFSAKSYLKWSRPCSCIPTGIVGPFYPWQELAPLTWSSMNKDPQVLLNHSIEDFCMAITLRVIGGAEPQLGATRAKQGLPELADEKGVSVRDKAAWKAMDLHDNVNKEGGH